MFTKFRYVLFKLIKVFIKDNLRVQLQMPWKKIETRERDMSEGIRNRQLLACTCVGSPPPVLVAGIGFANSGFFYVIFIDKWDTNRAQASRPITAVSLMSLFPGMFQLLRIHCLPSTCESDYPGFPTYKCLIDTLYIAYWGSTVTFLHKTMKTNRHPLYVAEVNSFQ